MDGHPLQIHRQRLALPLDLFGAEAQVMREPVFARLRPVEMNSRDGIPDSGQQLPLQLTGEIAPLPEVGQRRFSSHAGPNDGGNILSASAEFVFLHAAVNQWFDQGTTIPVKHAHPLRPVKPMRRQRDQIDSELLHVQRQPAAAESGIDEERDAPFTREPGRLGDWLDGAEVVTGVVQADERGVIAKRLAKRCWINPPLVIH